MGRVLGPWLDGSCGFSGTSRGGWRCFVRSGRVWARWRLWKRELVGCRGCCDAVGWLGGGVEGDGEGEVWEVVVGGDGMTVGVEGLG